MTRNGAAAAAHVRAPDWRAGALAGLVGGVVYTLFVEAVTIVVIGREAFFVPFRQIGAVVLGPRALDASYNLWAATFAGATVHLAIAAAFGIGIAWIRASLRWPGVGGSLALGVVAGLAMYALDVFAIFPAAFPWFLANDRLTQSLAHALFGAVTGGWLAWRRSE